MPNSFFRFKKFTVHQERCAMKVTTDACLFGAWVSNTIARYDREELQVLDVGTGTGLLTLMLAQQNPFSRFDAVEIDKNAAEQARENINTSPWKKQISIIHHDALTFPYQKKYDVIISNPPFYENELKSPKPVKNIARHDEGLLLADLLELIKKNLSAGGEFFLLLPFKRHPEIRTWLTTENLSVLEMILVKPSPSHDYFRMMLKGKLNPGPGVETIIREMTIWNEMKKYSPAFTELLKDFYLYL